MALGAFVSCIDESRSEDSFAPCLLSVELGFEALAEEILLFGARRGGVAQQPGVLQAVLCCHSLCWVHYQALIDKVSRGTAYRGPVFFWCVAIVGGADCLHFLDLAARAASEGVSKCTVTECRISSLPVTIERRVSSTQKVCDDTDSPDIDWLTVTSFAEDSADCMTFS